MAARSEAVFSSRYQSRTPRLLKAAYNFQLVAKDGAACVHDPPYAIQLLQDSLADLGEPAEFDTAGLARP